MIQTGGARPFRPPAIRRTSEADTTDKPRELPVPGLPGQRAEGNVDRAGGPTVGFLLRDNPLSAAWADGEHLAIATSNMAIHLWTPRTDRLRKLRGHSRRIRQLAWHPAGKRRASASNDHTVTLWDIATGRETLSLKHQSSVFAIAWNHNGTALATATDQGIVTVFDASRAMR